MARFSAPILLIFSLVLISTSCRKTATTSSDESDYKGFESLSPTRTKILNSNDLPETQQVNHFIWDAYYNGGGVAAGDVNNDGKVDLYFTNTMKKNALYLNKGNMEFEDATEKAGVGAGPGVNWGATMADINGDGWLDIYVCKSGSNENLDVKRNECFINQKDGTFKEMATSMGIDNTGYSVQAAFFDYDMDNDLDLFVMNQPNNARAERMKYVDNESKYIGEMISNRMYRNDGNLKFTDVSKESGVETFTYGLGLKICDLNMDHMPDVYVASDYKWADHVYINNGNGTFTNKVNEYFDHISNFSMGMDVGDINNDALDDIFVLDMAGINHYRSKTNMPSMSAPTFWKQVADGYHYQYMHNVLQLNRGNGKFSDISYQAGVSKTDWSWGVLMMDADNDGMQDIYVTNGIKRDIRNSDFQASFEKMIRSNSVPQDLTALVSTIPSTPLANFMFHNAGDLHFKDVANDWGLGQLSFSSGCLYADLDTDGDLDIVTNNVDAPAFVYENKANKTKRHFLQFELKTSKSKRPVEGTRINLYDEGKIYQTQYYHPVRGFMSSSEPIVHFGLGDVSTLDSVEFIWPDRNISVMTKPDVDKRHVVDQDEVKRVRKYTPHTNVGKWMEDMSTSITPAFVQKENVYDDFEHQLLLPYKISTLGPALDVADVNGDGRQDFFVGGGAGQSSMLYVQNANGGFTASPSKPWSGNTKSDVLGALFFDADGDKDPDLYVATGGSEFTESSLSYQDGLYLNDGKGNFTATSSLPLINTSTKAIAAGDWDKDGDLDLFVGSRNKPRKYPYADKSYFLRNDGGKFTDVTSDVWSESSEIGMISDAVFADRDKDGDADLLICGDWMAPTWLNNDGGKFSKADIAGINASSGWWNSVQLADINGDGHMDILAGNAGTNNKFKATGEAPFIVLASDFDLNGASDIVLATQFEGKEVPVRGRECSSQQLPYIAEEFPTYEGFATASLQDIIGEDKIKGSLRLELTEFKSGIFWGQADGAYKWEAFPVDAQLSPIVGFSVTDINGDGKPEVIGAGNLYDTEVETTRYDAGQGVIMSYADGKWKCHTPLETGFYANGNIRAVKAIKAGDKDAVLCARSNGGLSMYMVGSKPLN